MISGKVASLLSAAEIGGPLLKIVHPTYDKLGNELKVQLLEAVIT
jgi:hypothetical protein